jgi:hypothetical protein
VSIATHQCRGGESTRSESKEKSSVDVRNAHVDYRWSVEGLILGVSAVLAKVLVCGWMDRKKNVNCRYVER